jgi:hypothetical protein
MTKSAGLIDFSANFEVKYGAPLDSRAVINTRADLLLTNTWNGFAYVGMLSVVIADPTPDNNGVYRLKAADYTLLSNWELLGSGGGGGGGVSGYTVQEYAILNSLMFG